MSLKEGNNYTQNYCNCLMVQSLRLTVEKLSCHYIAIFEPLTR